MKDRKRYIVAIIISIGIFIFVLNSIFFMNYHRKDNKYSAIEGIMDLSTWDSKDNDIIGLVGEWEFYPNKLGKYEQNEKYIKVPGSWGQYLDDTGSSEGSGTYRLIIEVPEDKIYGIKTKTIRSASRIFINDTEVISIGNPSLIKENFIPASKYKVGFAKSNNKTLELIIQVSSYAYRSGGIIQPIEFGSYESIMTRNNKDRGIDAFIISIPLVMSLYYLFIYFHRRKEIYFLYFSLTGLFMGLYFSTMNEQLLDLILDYDIFMRTKIQIFLMLAITLCFTKFTYYYFKEYINKKASRFISILLLFMFLLIFNDPLKPVSIPMGVMQIIVMLSFVLSYIYIFWILLKAIFNRADSSEYIIVVAFSMFCYWFAIFYKTLMEANIGYLHFILILIIMFGISFLMNHRLQQDYQKAGALSEKLIMYDRLKDDFLEKATKEFVSPLYVINNTIQSLFEGRKGNLNSEQLESLHYIYRHTKSLEYLTNDLKEVSKFDKDEIELNLKPIELWAIIEKMVQEMQITIDKPVLLRNQIPKNFPLIKADPDRFRQIIYNILHNAIKYTEKGRITLIAAIKEGQAEISIQDTGIGIEKKNLKEIFSVFYINNDRDGTTQGMGLGLPISKYLIESHGGDIRVKSVYGKGTEFYFTLPLWDMESIGEGIINNKEESYKENVNIEIKDAGKYSILVIIDELDKEKDLLESLHKIDFNILLTTSGVEALDILKKHKIDLVILDLMLTDMPGNKLCEKIRLEYSMAELPILLLTEVGRAINFTDAYKCEINDFQTKPINIEELISRIQSLLLMRDSVEESLRKEFQYFYSQISPHFLYNTLNTIIGLSYKDTEKAREALHNLSTYFRGKLEIHRQKNLIKLYTELELAMAYLEIEKIRYGERLKIQYNIEEGINAMIPPLTLQPLIENAIRHGIASIDKTGIIKISVTRAEDGYAEIKIEDNGVGMSLEKQKEILTGSNGRMGFSSVLKRIRILKDASLSLKSELGKGTEIKIIIPEVKYIENHIS